MCYSKQLGDVFTTAHEHTFACLYHGFMAICQHANLLDVNISFWYFLFWDLVNSERFLFHPSLLRIHLSL